LKPEVKEEVGWELSPSLLQQFEDEK